MKEFIDKIKTTFLNKTFIIFVVIGCINTLIHFLIYNASLFVNCSVLLSNTIAFIIASLFSYFANTKYTYNEKAKTETFWKSFLTFGGKLLLSNGLTWIFEILLIHLTLEKLIFLIPIPVTMITLPLQYIAFNYIFKKKKEA